MQYSASKEKIQTLLASADLTRLEKVLLVLFLNEEKAKTATEIQNLAFTNGLRECKNWNVSDILSKSKGKAISISEGWIITNPGKEYLKEKKFITDKSAVIKNDIADLRKHASKINNTHIVSFLEEAIACLEADQNRAAVVFSWVGAVAILYDTVVQHHLVTFNAEAFKRDSKWKTAKNADDLSRMKEFDFLNILESISVIGKNVRQELQQGLQLRNSCGHPNSLKIGVRKVAAHIEILMLNVYSKF